MKRLIGRFIFKTICGWRTEGFVPPEIEKFVIIAAPHTSNWDFFYGKLYFWMHHIPANFIIKQEMFVFPFGYILKALGAIPVDRSSKQGQIESIAKVIKAHNKGRFALLITPEGTRKRVSSFKKGFYLIAEKAKVPIVQGYIDYEHKIGGFGPVFYPTGNANEDIEKIRSFYYGIKGKYPEQGVFPNE